GKIVERRVMAALPSRGRIDSLAVELLVDRVGSCLTGVEQAPDRAEAVVILPAAERAGPVSGGERRRLVEEEELGEPAGLHQRLAVPAAEPEAAGDPALPVVASADP